VIRVGLRHRGRMILFPLMILTFTIHHKLMKTWTCFFESNQLRVRASHFKVTLDRIRRYVQVRILPLRKTLFSMEVFYIRRVMQEHRSKPATCQPASTSKRVFNGEEKGNPLTFKFQILKLHLMIVRPKIQVVPLKGL
jgi:hypothetical protein